MSALVSGVAAPLMVGDALLIQRVVSHVVTSQSTGKLPWLAWHSHLSAADRRALHARWPLRCALWEELEDRSEASPAGLDNTGLLIPLHELLLAHRSVTDPAITVLATVLASACLGSHHLWQDLGAASRDDVSRLLWLGFPALHDSNHRQLRWKRHLFLVLGEQLGQADLHPPKCEHCDHHDHCFGSPAPGDATNGLIKPSH